MTRLALLLSFLLAACGAIAQPHSRDDAFDPQALDWLNRTVAAYAHLQNFDQKTEFSSAIIPLDPPKPGENTLGKQEQELKQTLRLLMSRPNKLRLESTEPDSFGRLQTAQTVCDGKFFWTFNPDKNWYTKDKAPHSIPEFAKLKTMNSGSLEMLMLMDVNPFVELKKTATQIRDEGEETLRETVVHWVRIVMDSPTEQTILRLALGKTDGLIRRVIHEQIPVAVTGQAKPVEDGLEALRNARRVVLPDDRNQQPVETTSPRMTTRLTYDNFFSTSPNFAFDAFAFTIPTNALLYGDTNIKKRKEGDFVKTLKQRADAIRRQVQKP